jgi:hypothetical protein
MEKCGKSWKLAWNGFGERKIFFYVEKSIKW